MANLQEKTNITKGFNGWTGETLTEVNGQNYKITTLKIYSKKIHSSARAVNVSENGSISYEMFTGQKIDLLTESAKATQKTITELHTKALLKFDAEIQQNPPKEVYKIEKGQIIFLNGYGQSEHYHEKKAIYNISKSEWGTFYNYINLDTLQLGSTDGTIKPSTEIFGIGTYYIKDEKISLEKLDNLVIEAKAKEVKDQKEKESDNLLESIRTSVKIEEGKKLVNIPSWAKSVIVADNYADDSDSMTDYFSTSIKSTVYLAYSKTTRNNMNELKKAAQNWGETKDLLKEDTTIEHTTGHSYLPNYFIGSSRWFGLKVNKDKYFDLTKEHNLNRLYIAAAEGRYKIPTKTATPKTATPKTETPKNNVLNISYVDYSPKAFAIIGETKEIKEQLKSLGGRFNFRLKCGAGWIFPKTKQKEVLEALNINTDVAAS